ncbi:hypothetical protein [Angustibacter luteus]|uniref:Acetylserotonin O-methyltransferase dimerisation domain-containing protein n=1 Tax=Angustibacter luteus TaxID=658456 RepID=A0ABW1JCZ0_9ACTN
MRDAGSDAGADAWRFADAWVLTAVTISQHPCDLVDLVAAADAVNHAIVTEAEVESSVGRLAAAGLLAIDGDDRFALTGEGAALVGHRQGGLVGQVASVLQLLRAVTPGTSSWRLPPGAWSAATAQYRRDLPG